MKPDYVAKKSVAYTLNFWLLLFSPLIIPLIIQIAKILSAKAYSLEFYNDKVICKKGVLNKSEEQSVFLGVNAVSLKQSFFGRIFGYGDVTVDCRGKWDIDTTSIKNPNELKKYLESRINSNGMTQIVTG